MQSNTENQISQKQILTENKEIHGANNILEMID